MPTHPLKKDVYEQGQTLSVVEDAMCPIISPPASLQQNCPKYTTVSSEECFSITLEEKDCSGVDAQGTKYR
jgi:hypothetical protein